MERRLQQTLALAGVAQSAFLVHQLAHHGLAAQDKLRIALDSLFVTRPRHTEEVFGKVGNLNLGLQVLQELLTGNSSVFAPEEVLRYLLGLLHLQQKLSRKPRMLDTVAQGLDTLRRQYPEGDLAAQPEAIDALATLYQDTLSTLAFRIQVRGDMQYLKNPQVAQKIRSALFAGVRAAVLWQQVGGRRWHLLLYRKRLAHDVNRLLHKLY